MPAEALAVQFRRCRCVRDAVSSVANAARHPIDRHQPKMRYSGLFLRHVDILADLFKTEIRCILATLFLDAAVPLDVRRLPLRILVDILELCTLSNLRLRSARYLESGCVFLALV